MAEEEVHTAAAADIVHERDKDDGVAHGKTVETATPPPCLESCDTRGERRGDAAVRADARPP